MKPRPIPGRRQQGLVEGEDLAAAQKQLQAKGYFVVKIKETTPAELAARQADKLNRHVVAPIFYPTSAKSLSIFFSSMKVMFAAGFNVLDMGYTLAQQTMHPMLKRAAMDMADAAREGRPMSSIMRKYPAAFDAASIAMIEAAEHSGMLEKTAEMLTQYYDRLFHLQQMYKSQTFYPKVLLVCAIFIPNTVTLVMSGFVPWLHVILAAGVPIVLGITAAWYGYRAARRVKQVRETMDVVKLSIPWFGSLARRGATARWSRALAMLIRAGVPLHQAILAAAATSGNSEVERSLKEAASGVQKGEQLAEVFARLRYMPKMAKDMVATAERAGSTEEALDKIADYYESETEVSGKQTAIVAGVLIFLLIALYIGHIVVDFWKGYAQGYEHSHERARFLRWRCFGFLPPKMSALRFAPRARPARQLGFVPTMGALHEGHLTLMRRARAENEFAVVSIFVNPTQFPPGEDFSRYPRDLEADARLCESVGVDLIFAPEVEEMYPPGDATWVEVTGTLVEGLCAPHRPGHFRGVTTVCARLFNIVQPDRAYFGEKDYQQLRVVMQMVRDLKFPLEIVPVPTVREASGLAMSSRNSYLNDEDRAAATVLSQALLTAREAYASGVREPAALEQLAAEVIQAEPRARAAIRGSSRRGDAGAGGDDPSAGRPRRGRFCRAGAADR